jgi:DNA-directed RNA polymerase specialized sigma24 family protein
MVQADELRQLSLAAIRQRCAEESERFFRRLRHDAAYCYELFRRALADGSAAAWDGLYAQYQRLVASWVRRHPSFAAAGEDADYFANRAFEKLHLALTPDKFSRMPDLQSVLRYLQMCVHSALVDYGRALSRAPEEAPLEALAAVDPDRHSPVEALVLDGARRDALWAWLSARLHTEQERAVIYGSFVLDLKPRELQRAFKDTFNGIDEVYRVKQNLLERLRRDPEFGQFLADA